jgi:hypothetical protein
MYNKIRQFIRKITGVRLEKPEGLYVLKITLDGKTFYKHKDRTVQSENIETALRLPYDQIECLAFGHQRILKAKTEIIRVA